MNLLQNPQFKTIKEAEEYIGGLSKPSKMPCPTYGISARKCKTGTKLRTIPGSTCADCYAMKGFYDDWNTNLHQAHAKRLEAMDKKGFIHTSNVTKYIYGFVGLVVLFLCVAALMPVAQDAGTQLENTTALGSLFSGSSGVIWIALKTQ